MDVLQAAVSFLRVLLPVVRREKNKASFRSFKPKESKILFLPLELSACLFTLNSLSSHPQVKTQLGVTKYIASVKGHARKENAK